MFIPDGGVLYFRMEGQEFKLTEDVASTLVKENDLHVFQLLRNGNLLVNFKYPSMRPQIPRELDPTPFVEDEDFDFFLFVHNVLTQTGRRQRVYN